MSILFDSSRTININFSEPLLLSSDVFERYQDEIYGTALVKVKYDNVVTKKSSLDKEIEDLFTMGYRS